MKKTIIFILLSLPMFVASCDDNDIHPIDDENSQETALFREQCQSLICGRWIWDDSTALAHIKLQYQFSPDGSFGGHALIMKRDSVSVCGKKVVTDWEDVIDNDIYGRWDLLYDSKLKKRVINMQYASSFKLTSNLFFKSVDSVLKVSVSLEDDKTIKMRRDN